MAESLLNVVEVGIGMWPSGSEFVSLAREYRGSGMQAIAEVLQTFAIDQGATRYMVDLVWLRSLARAVLAGVVSDAIGSAFDPFLGMLAVVSILEA